MLQQGDITKWKGDAIVNAANEMMLGGGGVDGAIHRRAGPRLRQACRKVPEIYPGLRCPTGEARITLGFDLPASYVIHTVGPIYDTPRESSRLLAMSYKNSLELANSMNFKKIAFPAISCGIYGYPLADAAQVALMSIQKHVGQLEEVHFLLFEKDTWQAFLKQAQSSFCPCLQHSSESCAHAESDEPNDEQGGVS